MTLVNLLKKQGGREDKRERDRGRKPDGEREREEKDIFAITVGHYVSTQP